MFQLKDLFFFIFILVVFLTGYGVASHSLLYPNESDFITFAEIFIKPYWNIFGELFLNEITYDPSEFFISVFRLLRAVF